MCVCVYPCMRDCVCVRLYVGKCVWFGLYASTIFESNPLLTPVDRQLGEKAESESEFTFLPLLPLQLCGIHRERPTKNYRRSIMKHDNTRQTLCYTYTHVTFSVVVLVFLAVVKQIWILLADNLVGDTFSPVSSKIRNCQLFSLNLFIAKISW